MGIYGRFLLCLRAVSNFQISRRVWIVKTSVDIWSNPENLPYFYMNWLDFIKSSSYDFLWGQKGVAR